ncbi:MAG: hypothetical protein HY914_03505 [Desulfomonile tiedjei]|nr:hypothetical protein [Desulfomonile tiedjei]
MRLIKRLIELAFFVFLLSLFGKNMDVALDIKYYGLPQPIHVSFWELVLFCVSLGIIIAAIGDFITQLRWLGEKRRLLKTDREHQSEVAGLNERIRTLEAERDRMAKELANRNAALVAMKDKPAVEEKAEDRRAEPAKSESKTP